MMIKILFIFLLVMNFSFAEDIVATVNGENISLSELENYYRQSMLTISNKKITMESSLTELINRELGVQKAKKQNLIQDPVVRKKVDDLLFHAQVSKDLEAELLKIAPQITDKDVEEYYKNNKEYRTSHILIRLRAFPTKEDVKSAYDQLITILNNVKNEPEKFDELASKYSQSSSAYNSGDLGFHPPSGYVPEFYEAIKGQNVGKIVGPVRTQYGVHLIKITGVKDFKDINKDVYKKILHDQKRDKVLADYFEKLRKSAEIKINKQYLK